MSVTWLKPEKSSDGLPDPDSSIYWNNETKTWYLLIHLFIYSLIKYLIRTPPSKSIRNIRPFNDGFKVRRLLAYIYSSGYDMFSGKWVTGVHSLTHSLTNQQIYYNA